MACTILRTVAAEDVAHLKGRPEQDSARGRRLNLARAAPLVSAGLGRRLIQRTYDAGDRLWRYGGVAGGGFNAAVAEQHLNGANLSAVFQQGGGKAVAHGFLIL